MFSARVYLPIVKSCDVNPGRPAEKTDAIRASKTYTAIHREESSVVLV